ncbi:MAG: FAD-dependent oxidoreductase [Ginsengibacter sp.]
MKSNLKKKIIIVGGGVAGLSAAHQLIGKGFNVEIYERDEKYLGGKARSIQNTNGNIILPAEHGFRFFPGFYGNVTNTMKQIKVNNTSVFKNLVPVSFYTFLFSDGRKPLHIPTSIGPNLRKFKIGKIIGQLKNLYREIKTANIEITKEGRYFFIERIFQLFTSCEERYLTEYERIPWSEFIEAERTNYGKDYKNLFAEGLTKNLVAVRADKASTRTGGKILVHMLWAIFNPFGAATDRVLNAPTNEAWINTWKTHLENKYKKNGDSFKIIQGKRVIKLLTAKVNKLNIESSKDCIYGVIINNRIDGGDEQTIEGDYFILAIPVERMTSLLLRNEHILLIDPTLRSVFNLYNNSEWMNGIIFYLKNDIPICDGHVTISDSDWAITMVSQTQYWKEYLKENPLPTINGKEVKTVLSVIVSNWDAKGKIYTDKIVKDMSFAEIKKEVWEQLKKCTLYDEKKNKYFNLTDDDCFCDNIFLDESIVINTKPGGKWKNVLFNKEPLLVNTIITHQFRPDSFTRLPNLFLAADYVKTHSDLACMDTADEAARRAVKGILEIEQVGNNIKMASYAIPLFFGLFKTPRIIDRWRYQKGLPWKGFELTYFILISLINTFAAILKLPRILMAICFIFFLVLFVLATLLNLVVLLIVSIINMFIP